MSGRALGTALTLVLAAVLLVPGPGSAQEAPAPPSAAELERWVAPRLERSREGSDLMRLRLLYLLAVNDRRQLEAAEGELARLRRVAPTAGGILLDAYAGALETARARHERWPPRRLDHLRAGADLLDGAVAAAPHDAEVRWLRLASAHFLPAVFGRRPVAREDRDALIALLPAHSRGLDPEVRRTIARFLLDHASLDPSERRRIEPLAALAP
jgi:hypothetical protein